MDLKSCYELTPFLDFNSSVSNEWKKVQFILSYRYLGLFSDINRRYLKNYKTSIKITRREIAGNIKMRETNEGCFLLEVSFSLVHIPKFPGFKVLPVIQNSQTVEGFLHLTL